MIILSLYKYTTKTSLALEYSSHTILPHTQILALFLSRSRQNSTSGEELSPFLQPEDSTQNPSQTCEVYKCYDVIAFLTIVTNQPSISKLKLVRSNN